MPGPLLVLAGGLFYGHKLLTVYADSPSTAAPAPGLMGTVTWRVTVVTLPVESATLSVTV